MNPGRNDPCPCGSGKKYKQCCLKTEQARPEDEFHEGDFLWRRIRRAIENSPARMLEFSATYFGKQGVHEAWGDFRPHWENEPDEPLTMDTPHMLVFMPWFFYEWLPDPRNTEVKREALDGRTLGQAYLDTKRHQLDPLLVRYIEQCCANPFSFYDVLSVRSGQGFDLRDIFKGEKISVTEHAASRQTQTGSILFGKLVTIDSVSLLESCAPLMFPPMEKIALLELRKKMERHNKAITPEVLRKYQHKMLDIYHDIADRLHNPRLPRLHNTDGDSMVFNKLIYELDCTPRAAFDALKELDLMEDEKDLLTDAEYDKAGDLCKIEFSWHKRGNAKNETWDNTILGNIKIEKNKMTIEVNSENRAQTICALIAEKLPEARYKTTVIVSPQAMLARAEEQSETAQSRKMREEQEALQNLPEVQAKIKEMMWEHYRKWPQEKIPALGGKTPLQAVKTRDGHEMVEALLLEFERTGKRSNPPLDPAIIVELRERLGLS